MVRIPTKVRIAGFQSALAVSALLVGLRLFIPDPYETTMRHRVQLCEAVAANGVVLVTQNDVERWNRVMSLVLERDDSLLSAGVRRADGSLLVELGEHASQWPSDVGDRATDAFVHVPINDNAGQWGRMELRYRPIIPGSSWQATLAHPWMKLIGFCAVICYGLFHWHLHRSLKQLDPSRAVPKRVRSAYDFLAGGLVALDAKQEIVLCNRAFQETVGLDRAKLMGRRLNSFQWQREGNCLPEEPFPWNKVADTKDPQIGTTLKFESAEQGVRTLMVNAAPVIGQDGDYRGVLVGFDDVTPLETAKAELETSMEAAEAANVAKSVFLANMSHEIRTPMNAIIGFADIMQRGFDESEAERQEYLGIIQSSGQHLLNLINEVLDHSKVESGQMVLEKITCHPHQIAYDVLSIFRVRASEKGIDLKLQAATPIPERITSDPIRLRQILTNLVGNAIKFTEHGQVGISIRMADGNIAFDVIDTGIGIATESLNKIFDPFSQADSSTTRRFGGTGLGLPISRRLAQLMGGDLTATSELGVGSVFTAVIETGAITDATMLTDNDVQEALRFISNDETKDIQLPPGRVLVVDDGASNRRLVGVVLRRAGVEVETADNGESGIEKALSTPFDAIFMDLQMPVMDGLTAMKKLKAQGCKAPIIALTAHAMKEEEARCRRDGFDDFVAKPINIDEIIAKLSVILGPPTLVPRRRPAAKSARQTRHHRPRQHSSGGPIECSLPMDDAEFVQIAADFVDLLKRRTAELSLLLEQKNFTDLAKQAHWLKGAGGTAGFGIFSDVGRQLENAAKTNNVRDSEDLINSIADLIARVRLPDLGEECPAQVIADPLPALPRAQPG